MWVYQFGYLDELRGFGDRPVWINPLWFWSAIQTCHKEAPGRARRASGLPKYPPARPRQDAPQRPNARINVRFAPKATEVLHCLCHNRTYAQHDFHFALVVPVLVRCR